MTTEPTLTDAQRAEWDAEVRRLEQLPVYALPDYLLPAPDIRLVIDAYLRRLESSHARLVEENRRLAADRDHWKEHAEIEERVSNRLSIDRDRLSRLARALTGYIPRDLWWPDAEMSWFDALCAALGILEPDRVDAALTPSSKEHHNA